MKLRWRVTPITPTGADVCRYFSAPDPIHGLEEGRNRIAAFVVQNDILRFIYTIDSQNPVSHQWKKEEHSKEDNRNLLPIIRKLEADKLEEKANVRG